MGRTSLKWALVARSFLIQGSWNYRTMLGSGTAWALLPLLRRSEEGGEAPADRMARTARHFNSHPYLSPLALAAVARLETEGTDPERIARFRDALRGPLGSLGDRLVWAHWRPTCLLLALLLAAVGLGPSLVVGAFLVLYNVLHLGLRVWGAHVGLELGAGVGRALDVIRLHRWPERIADVGVLLLGFLAGTLAHRGLELSGWGPPLLTAGAALFLIGFLGGDGARRWIPGLLAVLVVLGLLAGGDAPPQPPGSR